MHIATSWHRLRTLGTRVLMMDDRQAGPLMAYLRRIDRFSLLTPDQERELGEKWQATRDTEAQRRLVQANLRFVVKIAFEYRTYGLRLLDLIQEGNLGLLVAVDRFDPGRQNRLTTYAVWWIRAYIQEYIRRQWSLVRFGTTRAEQRCFYRLRRERQRLERDGGRADPETLAAALGVPVDELRTIELRITRRDQSLDDPLHADTDETRADRLADERPGPEHEAIALELMDLSRRRLRLALNELDPRERAIIERRYLRNKGMTLKELGRAFGISRERVRQLEARAKAKMRAVLEDVWEGAG
ncbi:MAG: RNA polymerase factor sigma-32 [Deltaproteobacteria bacterium]|nr:RNA polymerase factor sigma-32 [Deltaproteobacteria bacterium]